MNIGNQIKALRLRRGVTQEAIALTSALPRRLSANGSGAPLFRISECFRNCLPIFGVSIDGLFALSDDIRMDRIQNMLWHGICQGLFPQFHRTKASPV